MAKHATIDEYLAAMPEPLRWWPRGRARSSTSTPPLVNWLRQACELELQAAG